MKVKRVTKVASKQRKFDEINASSLWARAGYW